MAKRTKPATCFIGKRFTRLTVVEFVGNKILPGGRKRPTFKCLCDCGNEVTLGYAALKGRSAKSCGCLTLEKRTTHGESKSKMYSVWRSLHQRCSLPSHASYKWYGAKGIAVCERWKSYEAFRLDMGTMPDGMSIERIDSSGNYEPSNCKWATAIEQGNNKSSNRLLTLHGETRTIAEWARHSGVNQMRLRSRLAAGWPLEEALTKGWSRGQRRDLLVLKAPQA